MKGKFLFFLMAVSLLALSLNLTPGAASSPLKEVSGACPQTIFVNTGQALGNANSLSVALGDLDGDELADAVVGNAAGSGVWEEVWLNQGGGTFAFGQTFGENGDTPGVVLVDAEGDDDLDIIPAGAGSILFKNDGNGSFSMGQWLNLGYDNAIAVGELANGGLPEVVLAGNGTTTPAQAWFNTGDLFNPYTAGFTFTVSSVVDILIGNVDADLDEDVVFVNRNASGSEETQIWINEGNGMFSMGDVLLPGALSVSGAALGDVNGDELADIVLGFDSIGMPLEVWLNDGGGNFALSSPILSSMLVSDLALVDVDGDTDLDVVVSELSWPAQVWLNDGSGNYCMAQDNIGSQVNVVNTSDLDGNGSLDLFLASSVENEIWMNLLTTNDLDLSIVVEGDEYVRYWADYEITVANLSSVTAMSVTVEMEGYDLSALYWNEINPGTCDNSTRVCTLPALAGAQSATFRVGIDFEISGYNYRPSWVRAEVISAEIETNLGNNMDQLDIVLANCTCILCFVWAEWNNYNGTSLMSNHGLLSLDALIDLPLYYSVRDDILSTTPSGHHYTALYYAHDSELQTLILTDPDLFTAAVDTLLLWQPNLLALVDGTGASAIITQEQVDAADDFLEQIYTLASPELQAVIIAERANLPAPDEFVGKTMEEARGVVVGYGIFLPAILRHP